MERVLTQSVVSNPKQIEMFGAQAGPFGGVARPASIEGRGQLALAEDDCRLVIIVAHLGIARG